MKRFVSTILLLMFAVALFSGCGQQGTTDSTPSDQKEITIWLKKALTDVSNEMLLDRCEQFGIDKGVKVNVEVLAYEDFYSKWAAAIESGNLPDVTYIDDIAARQFYDEGLLLDVEDLYQNINTESAFSESLTAAMSDDGSHYAIPAWTSSQVLYYRKDLLEAANVEVPTTWEEFREVAIATTDLENGIYGAGIGFGAANSDADQFIRMLMWGFGSKECEDGKVVIDSPESVAAAEYVKQLFLEDRVTPPNSINWDDSGNNKAYLSGQCAMIFNTGSIYNSLKTDDPELFEKTGIAAIPAGPAGSFPLGIIDGYAVFKSARNVELGKELIDYLMDVEWYSNWVEDSAPLQLPVFPELAENDIWKEEANKAFLDNAQSYVYYGYPDELTAAAAEVSNLRLYNTAFQDILTETTDVATAIAELQTALEGVYYEQ